MKFKMRAARNGWILEAENGVIVYQDSGNDEDDIMQFADFLRFINDEYGPSTSRYSPKRIRIIIEPGDKYEA